MRTVLLHTKVKSVWFTYINNTSSTRLCFCFQMSLQGPPGPLGLTGRPGPVVRQYSDSDQICTIHQGFLQPLTSLLHSFWPVFFLTCFRRNALLCLQPPNLNLSLYMFTACRLLPIMTFSCFRKNKWKFINITLKLYFTQWVIRTL